MGILSLHKISSFLSLELKIIEKLRKIEYLPIFSDDKIRKKSYVFFQTCYLSIEFYQNPEIPKFPTLNNLRVDTSVVQCSSLHNPSRGGSSSCEFFALSLQGIFSNSLFFLSPYAISPIISAFLSATFDGLP